MARRLPTIILVVRHNQNGVVPLREICLVIPKDRLKRFRFPLRCR